MRSTFYKYELMAETSVLVQTDWQVDTTKQVCSLLDDINIRPASGVPRDFFYGSISESTFIESKLQGRDETRLNLNQLLGKQKLKLWFQHRSCCLNKRCHLANSDFRELARRIADKSVIPRASNKIDALFALMKRKEIILKIHSK